MVLAAFGKIVSDDQEKKADEDAQNVFGGMIRAQRQTVHHCRGQVGDHGHDPQEHGKGLAVAAAVFGISGNDQNAQPVGRQYQKGRDEHGVGQTAEAVGPAVNTPVGGQGFRQQLPQHQSHGNRQQRQQGGKDQLSPVFSDHGSASSGSVEGQLARMCLRIRTDTRANPAR